MFTCIPNYLRLIINCYHFEQVLGWTALVAYLVHCCEERKPAGTKLIE